MEDQVIKQVYQEINKHMDKVLIAILMIINQCSQLLSCQIYNYPITSIGIQLFQHHTKLKMIIVITLMNSNKLGLLFHLSRISGLPTQDKE